MELRTMEPRIKNECMETFAETGVVHLQHIQLPDAFDPNHTDVVFLNVPEDGSPACEIYISAQVQYWGVSEEWQRIFSQAATLENSRLVAAVRGDFITGLRELNTLLDAAGPRPVQDTTRENPARTAGLPAPAAGLRDLVEAARQQPMHFSGRDDLLKTLATSLLRTTKPGVIITGAPGVGKTALVMLLANRIAAGEGLPQELLQARLYEVSLGLVIQNQGRGQEATALLNAVQETSGENAIYFIDEVHQLGKPELSNLRDLLKPALADGRIRMIGATTVREWAQLQDNAFKRRFTEIAVPEPTPQETYAMIGPRIEGIAQQRQIAIPDLAMREAIVLAEQYIPNRTFPDKAIDLIDYAIAAHLSRCQPEDAAVLSRQTVRDIVAEQSNLPAELLAPETCHELIERTIQNMQSKIFGQERAIAMLGSALKSCATSRFIGWEHSIRNLEPLRNNRRPLACILAAGATGTGKTETAKLLASRFYNGKTIFLNGTDVSPEAPHGISMWVGSPPGYVGSDQGGVLTDGLRRYSNALIIVDEIEKAAPEAIQNCLLPLLGEGCVEDRNTGETLWATECIVFCTTNAITDFGRVRSIGLQPNADATEEGPDDARLRQALRPYLREEIIGRFNTILYYAPLSPETRMDIFRALTRDLERKLGEGTNIQFTEEALAHIADTLRQQQSGGRGVQEFFRETILPLVAANANLAEILYIDLQGRTFVFAHQ